MAQRGKDPYVVLGVSRSATIDEIKAAFKKQVKELHPDPHGGDTSNEERLREVIAAYAQLNPKNGTRADAAYHAEYGASAAADWFSAIIEVNQIWADMFGISAAAISLPVTQMAVTTGAWVHGCMLVQRSILEFWFGSGREVGGSRAQDGAGRMLDVPLHQPGGGGGPRMHQTHYRPD